mgnify:CR=1 FL=1
MAYFGPSNDKLTVLPSRGDSGKSEVFEIFNAGASALDLTNVRFTKGVEFDFSNGTVTSIDPGQRVVIVSNPIAPQRP